MATRKRRKTVSLTKKPVKVAEDAALSRPMLDRLSRIVREVQKNIYPNCTTLARLLEVSRRTVLRDIAYLRDRQQLPLAHDHGRNGLFFTEPVADLPMIHVTEGELLALFIAERSSDMAGNLATAQRLRAIARKISASMPDIVTLTLDDLSHSVTVQAHAGVAVSLETVRLLGKAIKTRRVVKFGYIKPKKTAAELREAWPLRLFTYDGAWYFLAYVPAVADTRTFHLTRIRDLVPTPAHFTPPAQINVAELLAGSFGIFFGKKQMYAVALEFDAEVAAHIAERRWHASQKNTPLPGGRLRVEFAVSALQDVLRWVLSWAPHVTVVAPQELRTAALDASESFVRRLRAK